jgi:NADH dehydrogenase
MLTLTQLIDEGAMTNRTVTLIGGSGFLGIYVGTALAKAGYSVQIASRHPEKGSAVKVSGMVGQVTLTRCDVHDKDSLKRVIEGSDAVINLTGILYQSGKQRFTSVHAKGAERIAKICKKKGVARFVHVSALGVDGATKSRYARTKLNGEKAVISAMPDATIIRPSVVFGPEDNFFNLFAKMARWSPFLPLIGGGKAKFQPVFAGDVAEAVVRILANDNTKKKTFELGGPDVLTFKEILEFIRNVTENKCLLLPLPFSVAKVMGAVMQLLPNPMLTVDQVRLLRFDNMVRADCKNTFEKLGITPRNIQEIVPGYLERFKKN